MKMQKSSPEMERTFEDAFPSDPRAERRKMFGFQAGFVNGNHFGGLFEDRLVLKLSEADRQTLVTEHGAAPFMPMGKPMTGYVTIPPSIVRKPQQLRVWVNRAFEYGASLPPKEKKAPQAKAAAKTPAAKRASR
jgi:TfoX/Sxy family transcriptional regulator of competence genes